MKGLYISPNELRERSREVEKLRQQHLEIMKKLRILVFSLSDSWKGEAQEAFQKSFLSKNQDMNGFSTTMAQYAQLLEQAANEAEIVDETLIREISRRLQ